jgi:hypothetical protein
MQGVIATADMLYDLRGSLMRLDDSSDAGKAEAAEVYRTALQDAGMMRGEDGTGGFGVVNGTQTIIPPGYTASQVDEALGLLRGDDIIRLPPMGTGTALPVRIEQLRGGHLVAAPETGKYYVALGDPASPDPRYLVKPGGDFYTLDLKQLMDITKTRHFDYTGPTPPGRPDLYRQWHGVENPFAGPQGPAGMQ